jgi:predicted nucleotidyltransferase component of viral defense system
MDKAYVDTVRLILSVLPELFRGPLFAMKGGTALNLFVHDMPRLSVDIDLAYTAWAVPREQALREISDENADIAQRLERLGLTVVSMTTQGAREGRLLVGQPGIQVKVETNLVFRGTVLPVEHRSLAPSASAMFSAELSVPTLARDELYGGKLVAALDRQHPRDLFDVWRMYETQGLSDVIIECFVTYLAGHNRPIHEVLFPRLKNLEVDYAASLAGMTKEPVELATLEAARERLVRELPQRLNANQRAFLISLARAAPDWSLLTCPHAEDLPAIRWRLQNLERFSKTRPAECARQAEELETRFGK